MSPEQHNDHYSSVQPPFSLHFLGICLIWAGITQSEPNNLLDRMQCGQTPEEEFFPLVGDRTPVRSQSLDRLSHCTVWNVSVTDAVLGKGIRTRRASSHSLRDGLELGGSSPQCARPRHKFDAQTRNSSPPEFADLTWRKYRPLWQILLLRSSIDRVEAYFKKCWTAYEKWIRRNTKIHVI